MDHVEHSFEGEFRYRHNVREIHSKAKATTHCSPEKMKRLIVMLDKFNLCERFYSGPFGHWLRVGVVKQHITGLMLLDLLVREVHSPNFREDEIWFEIGGRAHRFGPQEYVLITGLRFGRVDIDFLNNKAVDRRLLNTHFLTEKRTAPAIVEKVISKSEEFVAEDVLKVAYIFMVNQILFGQSDRKPVFDFLWYMIEDFERFLAFPWGTVTYNMTLKYLRMALKDDRYRKPQAINIYGCVWALEV